MARHLAICERKSAYPSRNEAKAAIVMHSMLDVLGLVRKPEEGPSGTSKKTITKQEPVIVEDNEVSQSNDSVEKEVKSTAEESDKKAVTNAVEEVEEVMEVTESLAEESKEKEKEAPASTEQVTIVEDGEKEQDDAKEVVEDENEAMAAAVETVEKDESEKIESGEVATEKEPEEPSSSQLVEDASETATVESSSDIVRSAEDTTETIEETATEASKSEKDDEVSTTLTESLVESQSENIEASPEETPIKHAEDIENVPEEVHSIAEDVQSVAENVQSVVEDVQSATENVQSVVEDVQSVAEEAEKELEVPQEPVGAREQVSPVNEMETSEVVQEKATLETEITSDDIQNIISDVVGEKSNTSMGFDVQTMDDSANMETETDINAFSSQDMAGRQIEDVAMNQEESMEVPDTNEVMDCEVVTPMETD